ncbi:hypothetical protein MC885_008440, partial [Smutsia gigantea]
NLFPLRFLRETVGNCVPETGLEVPVRRTLFSAPARTPVASPKPGSSAFSPLQRFSNLVDHLAQPFKTERQDWGNFITDSCV